MLKNNPSTYAVNRLIHLISWVARITTLANNPRLEYLKSRIRTFPAHFFVGKAKLNICVCTLVPFCTEKCLLSKKENTCFAIWACVDAQKNKFVPSCPIYWWRSMWWPNQKLRIGLVMRHFPCGANLWRSPANIQQKKSPAPGILFLTPAPRPLQVTFLLVKLTICACTLLQGQVTNVSSAKKTHFLQFGRALTQISWICPVVA